MGKVFTYLSLFCSEKDTRRAGDFAHKSKVLEYGMAKWSLLSCIFHSRLRTFSICLISLYISLIDPWSGKMPHAMEHLSLCTATTEPVLWSPGVTTSEPTHRSYWSPHALESVLRNERGHCSEKTMPNKYRVAPARCNQRKTRAATKTWHSHNKWKHKNKKL